MNTEQSANYLTAVLSTAVVGVIIPFTILGFLLWGLRVMVVHATNSPKGYIGRMLSDDSGKPSSDRLIKLVAVVITSWMCATIVFSQPQLIVETLTIYMLGWGGVDITKHWLSTRPALAAATPPPPEKAP